MKRYALLLLSTLVLLFNSCSDDNAEALKEHLQAGYTLSVNPKKLSSGSKAQYIQLEKTINQSYVKDLDSIVNTSFERQLEKFEDEELGVWSSYMNMFSWLFKSKQTWDDEMIVLSNKYFNTLDINQEQHALYMKYIDDIENIRKQFIKTNSLPSYTQINLPSEKITLDSFSGHTRNNLVIEFGSELFSWFLGFAIVQIVLLFVDKIAGPWGCLIDVIVFIVIIIISVIMANSNDSKLIDSLKEQQTQTIKYDSGNILKSLDENTIIFYEHL